MYLFEGLLENGSLYRFGTLFASTGSPPLGFNHRVNGYWPICIRAAGNKLPLTWLFVIQRNQKPSDDNFMNGAGAFFNQTEFPNALREHACLSIR